MAEHALQRPALRQQLSLQGLGFSCRSAVHLKAFKLSNCPGHISQFQHAVMHQGSHRGLIDSDYFPQNTKKPGVVAQNGHLKTCDEQLLGVDLVCDGF